jgi:hypothetical protein
VQEENAGLGGNRNSHFVRQDQAATPLEVLFRKDDLRVSE